MDRETLIANLVDHFKHPRHRGRLEHADVAMPGGNPGCGDIITMYVAAEPESSVVTEASFEGTGCTISQAAASILLKRINNEKHSFQEILDFSYDGMLDMLGREVVGFRHSCATLALGTLKAAVRTIEMDRKLRAAGYSDDEIQEMRKTVAKQASGAGLVIGEQDGGP